MPPKKKGGDESAVVMLGRPSNDVKIGIVGLPNVGKSSMFNLLSGLNVPAENFPFCTIDPSDAMVPVPDPRFVDLCGKFKPKKEIPAVLKVTDIAGLVKGAAEGKGLGNAFLSNIQAVDAIYHVTRAFADKDIEHVEGSVEPCRDFEIIRGELLAKDLEWCKTALVGVDKKLRAKKTKETMADKACMDKAIEMLQNNKEIRHGDWKTSDIAFLNTLNLLTAKPVVYLINLSRKNFLSQKSKWFKDIKAWIAANSPGDPMLPFSVTFEAELLDMDEEKRDEFLKEAKVPSMVPRIIKSGYKALRLINFFTVGPDEVRSWSLREGSTAPQAGGVIHGDFEKGFIKAEIYNYDAIKEHGDETAVKKAGKQRTMGKDYVMNNGDIAFFKANDAKKR
jgi:obg-like ATPase 1